MKDDNPYNYHQINKIFHSPIRLAVISLLMTLEEAEFTYIREKVGATDGNLNSHLKKLEDQGYIHVKKEFVQRKPLTFHRITQEGKEAFKQYIQQLEMLIKPQKES
jgi:DNA-binding MarR family transcriptional regulator